MATKQEISSFVNDKLGFLLYIEKNGKTMTSDDIHIHHEDITVIDKNANNGLRQITMQELQKIAYKKNKITLKNSLEFDIDPLPKTYSSPDNKGYFTVADIINIIEDFEKSTRPFSISIDEPDRSHVWFEGLYKNGSTDTEYVIGWGS